MAEAIRVQDDGRIWILPFFDIHECAWMADNSQYSEILHCSGRSS